MTAHGNIDSAVEAIKRGAYDFITKPFDFEKIELLVGRAVERKELLVERHALREQLKSSRAHGRSSAIPEDAGAQEAGAQGGPD